ncbi:unnamed protein product [Cylicocyclus nassatus]|uniref:BCD1 alpha/beta domain-containing protein n=1 Tax=Cylicocyclus nassatus TaxID=53992 RepID=A0AA36DLM4_CYLNA|nr:unnamed protein product [Cylicocyclus nassatus]
MLESGVKRPLEQAESSVFVPPLAKKSKQDEAERRLITISCEHMAKRDLKILRSLNKEDQMIFLSQSQWQRVLNLVPLLKDDKNDAGRYEYSLLLAELGRRGVGPIDKDWSWSSPVPVLPGYSSSDFPSFSSFITDNIPVEEECTRIAELCAKLRKKTDSRSNKEDQKIQPADKDTVNETQTTYKTAPPLNLRKEIRDEREQLLVDMAASRLFTLAFSADASAGSSRYDVASDAILWSIDLTFHLDTKDGPKEETFVVHDTSEKDALKPNIDSVIYFDDVEESITTAFAKASERSNDCINVFSVTPSVSGVNGEPEYHLVNAEDTLLESLRGKLVVDRPRFLIVLKSQSMQFLRKPGVPNTTPQQYSQPSPLMPKPSTTLQPNQPTSLLGNPPIFPAPNVQPMPTVFAQRPPSLFGPCPFNFAQLVPPAPSIFANNTAQLIPTPAIGPTIFAGPSPAQLISAGATASAPPSRQNLVVLTNAPTKTSTTNAAEKSGNTQAPTSQNGAAEVKQSSQTVDPKVAENVAKVIPIATAGTPPPHLEQLKPLVLRPVTAKKGTGKKFTPLAMAKRDVELMLKYPWEVQKQLVFKLPLNRAINLSYHLRKTFRSMELNNVRSLLPTRFHNIGIDKIPNSWDLTQPLPMLPGHVPIKNVTPITEFEIDEAADSANFEQVAKSLGLSQIKNPSKEPSPPSTKGAPASSVSSTSSPKPASQSDKPSTSTEATQKALSAPPSSSSSVKATSAQSDEPQESKSSTTSKATVIELPPSEMAYRDYLHLKEIPLAEMRVTIDSMQLVRLVNLGYYIKKYPPKMEKRSPINTIKSLLFDRLSKLGVGRLEGWNRSLSNIPGLKRTSKFGRLPKTFRDVRLPGEADSYVWPGLPEEEREKERLLMQAEKEGAKAALELQEREAAKAKGCTPSKNVNSSSSKPEVPKVLTKELPRELPKFFPSIGNLLKMVRGQGVYYYISSDTKGAQSQKCKCEYDASKDSIRWSLEITLEVCKHDAHQVEKSYAHYMDGKDSLESILSKHLATNPDKHLAAEFKQTMKENSMKFFEMSLMLPIIKESQMVQLERVAVDYKLPLLDAIKSKVVVDCPRFIVRDVRGFKQPPPQGLVIDVDTPLFVLGGSSVSPGSAHAFSFKDFAMKAVEDNADFVQAEKPVEEAAFSMTPLWVASNDRELLKTLAPDDQKLIISLMPWDRLVALILHLRLLQDPDAVSLLILCNPQLAKLGIADLPRFWTTAEKVPILPGHPSSAFKSFSMFNLAEAPLVSKTMTDVRYLVEEVTALRSTIDVPEVCMRFEPNSYREQRLYAEAHNRDVHFAFSLSPDIEDQERSHYDFTTRTILWSVEIVCFRDNNGTVQRDTQFLHGLSEKTSIDEMVRQAVLQLRKDKENMDRYGSVFLDEATRFVDVLYMLPRIQNSKFDFERYQKTKMSTSLLENLKGKLVLDHPRFMIVLIDQVTMFSSKMLTQAQEKSLFEFEKIQRDLAQTPNTGPQFLNLFDLVHKNLTMELNRIRTLDPGKAEQHRKRKPPPVTYVRSEAHLNSPIPYEVPSPANCHYGPQKILPQREMTFNELKHAEDMIAMGCHRNMHEITQPLNSCRAVPFLSRIAQYWGFKLKEEISLDANKNTRMVVHFEGLPKLVTMGQCNSDGLLSATVGAHTSVIAALCYMLIVPFEMWKTVMDAPSEKWIDPVIYACRERFAHLMTLIYSGDFLKLIEFSGDLEAPMSPEVAEIWHRFMHKIRSSGIWYWEKNRDIQIPLGIASVDFTTYPGSYFRFAKCESVIDWTVMKPKTGWNNVGAALVSADPVPIAKYSEQEYETGLLPARIKSTGAPVCPVTGAENWHEPVMALPQDALVQITARDCETRGDKVGSRFINPVNSRLLEEISKRLKCKILRTHLVQWESNSQFTNWFHLVNVKLEGIAPFFLQGLGKHVKIKKASQIADSYIISSFCRMGIIPLEMYNLIHKFGEEWIDPVLYVCRERFAIFQKLINNPVFYSLNTLAKADLYRTTNQDVPHSKFSVAYEFARVMRDTALRYWSDHQLVGVPKSIPLPISGFKSRCYFIFVPIEGFERWDDFKPAASEVEYFEESSLLPVTSKVPPWEKVVVKEKKNPPKCTSLEEACAVFYEDVLSDECAANMRQFVESLASSISRKLIVREEQANSEFFFELKFSGESGDLLHGRALDIDEQVAYKIALCSLYLKLLKGAFVLPSLNEFVARRFQMDIEGENFAMARLPYVEKVIKPLLQRFEMMIRRYRALITGCEKSAKKKLNEQLLSMVRRLNEDVWRTHPIPLPLHIFLDYEDPEGCRNNLQNFVEILEPTTIWIGDIKFSSSTGKSDLCSRYEYALTMNALGNEKVTVTLDEEAEGLSVPEKPVAKALENKKEKIVPPAPVQTANPKPAKSSNGTGAAAKSKDVPSTKVEVSPAATPTAKEPAPDNQEIKYILPWDKEHAEGGGDEVEEEEGDEYLD